MECLLDSRFTECVNEFMEIYQSSTYISKKTFDTYYDKYKDVFECFQKYLEKKSELYEKLLFISQNGYQKINEHNQQFIKLELLKRKEYFDNLFLQSDPNIILDEEQRKAILIDEDYSLIIAGAGSGKTTTMAAKVKYLIEIKKIKPSEIILLAFTNKAASELSERINQDFQLHVDVLTFHKLGMRFLREIFPYPLQIIGDSGIRQVIIQYVKERIFPNKKLLYEFIHTFDTYVYFDESCLNYKSFNEYYQHYMDKKYEQCKYNLKQEIQSRIQARSKFMKSINGEYLKSEGEVKVANYLYQNSIPYYYEKVYPYRVGEQRSYSPDFTILNFDENIYLEYYGLASLSKDGEINCFDKQYKSNILKKRKNHQHYHTNLIELFSSYEDKKNILDVLDQECRKYSLVKREKSEKEIFYRLMETSQDSQFLRFVQLMIVFIQRFKEMNMQLTDFDLLIEKETDEKLKKQLKFTKDLYLYYQNEIHKKHRIDFADMINFSYKSMDKLKEKLNINYKYLIIDEYQDISSQRYSFAKRITELFQAKLVAVGDDWQSIYSFSGSDIKLFTEFCDLMGYGEIIKIKNTYRNSQELIDLAGDFISKSNYLFQKDLYSKKHLNKPVELVSYDLDIDSKNTIDIKLEQLLAKIYQQDKTQKILLLGRYRSDIDIILASNLYHKGNYDQIICNKYPQLYIDFLTVHKAKGLGYDQVILINALDDTKGFPSKIKDEPLIQVITPAVIDNVSYSEERRLFYVALTRTKNKLYILCPSNYDKTSEFIKEIEEHNSVLQTK